MNWLIIVVVFAAVVIVAWLMSQRAASAPAEGQIATLAAHVGGVAHQFSIHLTYEGMPAEGAVVEDRAWEREGRVARILTQYVWKVQLITPNGPRTSYYPMASVESVPGAEEFLAQLARLADSLKEQG